MGTSSTQLKFAADAVAMALAAHWQTIRSGDIIRTGGPAPTQLAQFFTGERGARFPLWLGGFACLECQTQQPCGKSEDPDR